MAQVSQEGGGSRLSTDLNLVPFIDLLSTLVLFLLVTAVWLQVSVVPAATQKPEQGQVANAPPVTEYVRIRLTPQGLLLRWPESLQMAEKEMSLPYNFAELSQQLKDALKKSPSLKASVAADDTVEYAKVISAIDNVRGSGFDSVAISPD